MKLLLVISAAIEAAIGASLLILPTFTALRILGVTLDTPPGQVAGRIAGAALIALAIACWNTRNGKRDGLAKGVVIAILFYDLAAVSVLVYAGISLGLHGPLLWPTIVLHLALAVCAWLVSGLRKGNLSTAETA